MIYTPVPTGMSIEPFVSAMARGTAGVLPGIHNGSSGIFLNVIPTARSVPMAEYRSAAFITASGRLKISPLIIITNRPAHGMKSMGNQGTGHNQL